MPSIKREVEKSLVNNKMRAVRDLPIPPAERWSMRKRKYPERESEACWSPVLAQRAVSEDPRWTRAMGDQTDRPARGRTKKLEEK
jgi:hypothetical protein